MAKKKAVKSKAVSKPEETILDLARAHLLSKGKAFVLAFENDSGAMEVCMFGPKSKDLLGLSGIVSLHANGMALAGNPGIHKHFERAVAVSAEAASGGR